MEDSECLTTEDLRNRMFQALKRRGFVDVLKTQLRNRLVSELKDVGLVHTGGHTGQEQIDTSGETPSSGGNRHLLQRAVNSLLADHLRRSSYNYTLSVFLPESSLSNEALLTLPDILQLLQISSQSKLYKKLAATSQTDRGLLWNLLSELSLVHQHPAVDSGVQTDSSRYGPVTSLEEQFAQVDALFSTTQDTQLLRLGAVEERILCYQRQLEERSRTELNMMMSRFRDTELAQARVLEREASRKEIDTARREMERTYQAKFDTLRERERQAVEQLQRQQEIAEKETYSQRQSLLQEVEALKQRDMQLRRQHDIDNREKALWEEKVKAREELAKHREESARRTELEFEHRIRDQVEKFKLEERTRYVDRLTNVEFREARIKETERRLEEQLQDVSDVRVELKEKRSRVTELEAELIRTRHELLAAQKQTDVLTERTREMVDYQMLKEDNAVLRRELDNTKMRLAEVMRDIMVERQKQEELLREMGQQLSKPTPEVALLRQQIEQLHSRQRTELAIVDQERLMLQQRLQDEIGRNKELVMKCEEQTWQQKQIGLEALDLRERLLDSHHVMSNQLYRRPSALDRSGSISEYHDMLPPCNISPADNKDSAVGGALVPADVAVPSTQLDNCSFSSDLVQETKNRLHRLETEAEMLEKSYQSFQLRVTSLDPVLDPDPIHRPGAVLRKANQRPATGTDLLCSGSSKSKIVLADSGRGAAGHRTTRSVTTLNFEPKVSRSEVAKVMTVAAAVESIGSSSHSGSSIHSRHSSQNSRQSTVDTPSLLAAQTDTSVRQSHGEQDQWTNISSFPHAEDRVHVSGASGDRVPVSVATEDRVLVCDASEGKRVPVSSTSLDRVPIISASGDEVPVSASVDRVTVSGVPVGLISLDDAWKTSSSVQLSSAWRDEERKHRGEEEAEDHLQQQAGLQLVNKHKATRDSGSEQNDSDQRNESTETATLAEPKIDPVLEKYMAIVQQQKQAEKRTKVANEEQKVEEASASVHSPINSPIDESISVADDNSNSTASEDDKEDFW